MSTSTITAKVSEAAKVVLGIPDMIPAEVNLGFGPDLETNSTGQQTREICAKNYIWLRLKKLGIYNDEDSAILLNSDDCAEGDARRVFCENGEPNLPLARFKRVWSILKGKGNINVAGSSLQPEPNVADSIGKAFQAIRPIDNWSDEELIEKYGPDCPNNIIEELLRRSKGRAFVIFKNEETNTLDGLATLRMLREARKRETPVHYKSEDSLKRLYKAGDFPNQVYEECPLHSHVLLLDGYCDECGHTWEGVSEEARQFVRVATGMGEAPTDGPGIRQLIATARISDKCADLENDYPKVGIRFRDLKTEGKLPSLKSRKAISGKQDPFGKRF